MIDIYTVLLVFLAGNKIFSIPFHTNKNKFNMKKNFVYKLATVATATVALTGIAAPAASAAPGLSSLSSLSSSPHFTPPKVTLPPVHNTPAPKPANPAPAPGTNTGNTGNTVVVDGVRMNHNEARMLTLVNEYRAKHGLNKLKASQKLYDQSRAWSKVMAGQDKLYHSQDNVYENIAYNHDITPEAIFTLWKNSPGHNANMLAPDVHVFGYSNALRGGKVYSTMQLIW